jgi:hypothetical protein
VAVSAGTTLERIQPVISSGVKPALSKQIEQENAVFIVGSP